MQLSTSEKIKILLERKNMTVTRLAEIIEISRQSLTTKLSQNNFKESDLKSIAAALDCDYKATFIMKDTGEVI